MSALYISITYPVSEPDKFKIRSNVKKDLIADTLCTVIQIQMGKSQDNRKAKKLKTYKIRIDLDLSYDHFSIRSDTGNDGLTTGIIMDVISRLENE